MEYNLFAFRQSKQERDGEMAKGGRHEENWENKNSYFMNIK